MVGEAGRTRQRLSVMRALVGGLLSLVFLTLLAESSEAADNRSKNRRRGGYSYTAPVPNAASGATERQLRNQRAYERGEYYEHDSNALPFGSRAWWEQKERERADEH
jgi:hypothetical protein